MQFTFFALFNTNILQLLDVLVKWCKALAKGGKGGILIEKDIYIKLYETKTGADPKNSFVWVTVSLTSCASMSIYIAMHRDIPFIEQQEVRTLCAVVMSAFNGNKNTNYVKFEKY